VILQTRGHTDALRGGATDDRARDRVEIRHSHAAADGAADSRERDRAP
jgi:hypothetical protein